MPKIINNEKVYKETCLLLEAKGFDGVTTKEIAMNSNIDESSLFRKYVSKTKLVCSAVNYTFSKVSFANQQWTGNLEEDLYNIVESYKETANVYGPLLQVVIMELPRHPDLKGSVVSAKNNISNICSIIKKYQDSNVLKKGNSMDLVASLIGPLAMIAMSKLAINMKMPETKDYVSRFLIGNKN